MKNERDSIKNGKALLGIELGSTRIKAVLINETYRPIASGEFTWENKFENGIWTYSLDEVWAGIQHSYRKLSEEVKAKYDVKIKRLAGMGISAMMHGYLAFDKKGKLLVPFRTWRNTTTGEAAQKLTECFGFNIPHRWSIAHLYQAILNGENHVCSIDSITLLQDMYIRS